MQVQLEFRNLGQQQFSNLSPVARGEKGRFSFDRRSRIGQEAKGVAMTVGASATSQREPQAHLLLPFILTSLVTFSL